jgi:cell volume regulation protein A
MCTPGTPTLIASDKFLLLISSMLFLCYVSGLFYTKTRIPDILWLLGFGILLGPVLGVFEKDSFASISPLMGTVAICIITFDSGISLDMKTFQKTFFKALVLTLATFFAIVAAVGFSVSLLMPESFSLQEGMLLGTMVAGISTVAVTSLMPSLCKLVPNMDSSRALLNLESTLCDPIRMVVAVTIIRMIMLPGISIKDSAKDIIYTFVMGSLVGLVLSLAWAEVLDRLRGQPFNYIMTMAALFPTYLLGERIGDGGGTMAAFVFGFALANYQHIARLLNVNRRPRPDKARLIEFNEEIVFLLKSYYFVYIGLIASISWDNIFAGFGIVAILITVRYIVATGVGRRMGFSPEEKVISRVVYALGTSTLVMSQLPTIFDPEMNYIVNPWIYTNLCFPIILGTVLFAAAFSPMIAKRQLNISHAHNLDVRQPKRIKK